MDNIYLDKPSDTKLFPLQLAGETIDFECPIKYLQDGYCDDLCRTDQCSGDIKDCNLQCIDDYCSIIYRRWTWLLFDGSESYAVNYSVACNILETGIEYDNKEGDSRNEIFDLFNLGDSDICSIFLCLIDWNEDGYINFREFTTLFARFSDPELAMDKSIGLNCSNCIGDMYDINMIKEGDENVECDWTDLISAFLEKYEGD